LPALEFSNVSDNWKSPSFLEAFGDKLICFALDDGFNSVCLGCEGEAAEAGEQIDVFAFMDHR